MIYFDIETIKDLHAGQDSEKLAEKYGKDFDFMPEFNRILTIAVGMRVKDNPDPYLKNLEGDEAHQIDKFFQLVDKHDVCGWNIKAFDVPFVLRRALKHNIPIPDRLKLHGKKPWEMDAIFDLKDAYKHAMARAASLGDVCDFLGIPTPKDAIDGSMVQAAHDRGEDDKIREYCKKDVGATMAVAERLKLLNFI